MAFTLFFLEKCIIYTKRLLHAFFRLCLWRASVLVGRTCCYADVCRMKQDEGAGVHDPGKAQEASPAVVSTPGSYEKIDLYGCPFAGKNVNGRAGFPKKRFPNRTGRKNGSAHLRDGHSRL